MKPNLNQSIPLGDSHIIKIDDHEIEEGMLPITFKLPLFSDQIIQSIIIELPQDIFNKIYKKEQFLVSLANGVEFDSTLIPLLPGTTKVILRLALQPTTVKNDNRLVKQLKFPILNFPPITTKQSKCVLKNRHINYVPYIRINMPDWDLEISGEDNLKDIWKILQEKRMMGITYEGQITCQSKNGFTVEEAKRLLNALRIFLSFFRGANCGFPWIVGVDDHDQTSWVRWGSHYVDPWNNQHSVFKHVHWNDTHSKLFLKFWEKYDQGNGWDKTLRKSISWYLLSNNTSTIDVGIILAQVALERLSFQILNRSRKKGELTAQFIHKAFEEYEIETMIPPSCNRLKMQQKNSSNFENGIDAVVKVRNNFIHPDNQLNSFSIEASSEIFRLVKWYIEMLLLKIMGYHGKYNSRLISRFDSNTSSPFVPWAKPE